MCDHPLCRETPGPLTLETLIRDPLTRLVMQSDNVSETEFLALLYRARNCIAEPAMQLLS